jgi:hypothetical protein
MPCFIAGIMKAMTSSQLYQYSEAEATFLRVNTYNQGIQTRRLAGDISATYYVFKDSNERNVYIQGRFLLIQNDPTNAAQYRVVQQV